MNKFHFPRKFTFYVLPLLAERNKCVGLCLCICVCVSVSVCVRKLKRDQVVDELNKARDDIIKRDEVCALFVRILVSVSVCMLIVCTCAHFSFSVFVCVCVCERERERKRERESA